MTKIGQFQKFIDSFFVRNGDKAEQVFSENVTKDSLDHESAFIQTFPNENPFVVEIAFHILNNVWHSGENDGFDN